MTKVGTFILTEMVSCVSTGKSVTSHGDDRGVESEGGVIWGREVLQGK